MPVEKGGGRPRMCRNSAALYIPCSWIPLIKQYMEREGITNYTALLHHLMAKCMVNKHGEVSQ